MDAAFAPQASPVNREFRYRRRKNDILYRIPVQENVLGVCEILGLDPLYLANEGKMVLFCPAADAQVVLAAMRNHKYGKRDAVIAVLVM